MHDGPDDPSDRPKPRSFPSLTIIQAPEPPKLSAVEKFGGLFYLGIGGLIVLISLLSWFGYQVWSLRDVFSDIYVIHDEARPVDDRILAAYRLGQDPRVNARQLVDIVMRKALPPLSRYVLAERFTTDVLMADPAAYAKMVALSEGWPDWLRLQFMRPMAYAVNDGYRFPWEPLDKLRESSDPAIALWATYIRGAMEPGDAAVLKELEQKSQAAGPFQELAIQLCRASKTRGKERRHALDEATRWLRTGHPEIQKLWDGWEERDGTLQRTRTPQN